MTDKEYWLCCGSTEFFKHRDGCCEAQIGHPEHCRWGTADQHSLWQIKSAPKVKQLSDEIFNKAFDFYCETDEGVLRFDFELREEWKQEQLKRWKEAFIKASRGEE